MSKFYETRLKDISGKHLFIGSIFPEKRMFENGKLRTARMNEAVRLICLANNDLDSKKVDEEKFFSSSTQVEVSGKISNHLFSDLRLISRLSMVCNSSIKQKGRS
jgi:hypothetical protein